MSDEFNWNNDNPNLILATQMAVAIFENERDEVCVRQQAEPWMDDDQWVTFTKDRAVTVARAILKVAGIDPTEFARTRPCSDEG